MGIHVFQVVLTSSSDAEPALGWPGHEGARGEGQVAFGWHPNTKLSAEVPTGKGLRGGCYFIEGALSHNFSAEWTCPRTNVDDVVGRGNGVVVVFDYQNRVTKIT